MSALKLYMLLLGASPKGRHVEQHDIFFGIAHNLTELVPELNRFWPEAKGKLHIDAWRKVNNVDGYRVSATHKVGTADNSTHNLFFINLGGYQKGMFDEQHFRVLTVQPDKDTAKKHAKKTWFYKEVHIPGAPSHIDDTYALDVDDIYDITEILPLSQKEQYTLTISKKDGLAEDELHLGYFTFNALP